MNNTFINSVTEEEQKSLIRSLWCLMNDQRFKIFAEDLLS